MRRPRIHRPGELYYLVGRSNGAKPLFRDLQDYDCFKATLAGAARQCRATIYAFCLEPSSFHLAVRISNVSTGQLMAFLGRHYVEAFHRRNGGRGALLVPHYRALLVDGEYLAELVRFIVWVSVRAGCADTVEDWQQSSHPAYMGSVGIPWVDCAAVLATFDPDIELARRKYAEFVRTPTSGFFARGFERGLLGEPRVFGSTAFLRRLGLDVQPALSRSLEDAIRSICWYCGITKDELICERRYAYARALTAWYVRQRQIDGLVHVARYFKRHWSTLQSAIQLHQEKSPELFDADAIHRARPLLPVPRAPAAHDSSSGRMPQGRRRSPPQSIRASRPLSIEQKPSTPAFRRRRPMLEKK
ncbi:MAG TPA: hypothetical protein VHB68_00490 [Steroidobacteraceae bacterium]|nr:hypothetical protein [Steroidobacteraceae bacterium]